MTSSETNSLTCAWFLIFLQFRPNLFYDGEWDGNHSSIHAACSSIIKIRFWSVMEVDDDDNVVDVAIVYIVVKGVVDVVVVGVVLITE